MGCCYHCGTRQAVPVRKQDTINVIEYLFRCPACHRKNFLHFVDLPEARDYYQIMGRQLRAAERIIVFGVGKDASDFCFYDLFGLDLDRIVGFVDPRGAAPEKKFYHLPRYRLADLETVDYDLILVTDLDRSVAKLLLCTSTVAQSKPVCFLAPSKLSVPERRRQPELVGAST
jgi:hypothetical protein